MKTLLQNKSTSNFVTRVNEFQREGAAFIARKLPAQRREEVKPMRVKNTR